MQIEFKIRKFLVTLRFLNVSIKLRMRLDCFQIAQPLKNSKQI